MKVSRINGRKIRSTGLFRRESCTVNYRFGSSNCLKCSARFLALYYFEDMRLRENRGSLWLDRVEDLPDSCAGGLFD